MHLHSLITKDWSLNYTNQKTLLLVKIPSFHFLPKYAISIIFTFTLFFFNLFVSHYFSIAGVTLCSKRLNSSLHSLFSHVKNISFHLGDHYAEPNHIEDLPPRIILINNSLICIIIYITFLYFVIAELEVLCDGYSYNLPSSLKVLITSFPLNIGFPIDHLPPLLSSLNLYKCLNNPFYEEYELPLDHLPESLQYLILPLDNNPLDHLSSKLKSLKFNRYFSFLFFFFSVLLFWFHFSFHLLIIYSSTSKHCYSHPFDHLPESLESLPLSPLLSEKI